MLRVIHRLLLKLTDSLVDLRDQLQAGQRGSPEWLGIEHFFVRDTESRVNRKFPELDEWIR